jgi:hypothetical protein
MGESVRPGPLNGTRDVHSLDNEDSGGVRKLLVDVLGR